MTERQEKRNIKLVHLKDGTWVKTGVGKPICATEEEVALWEGAQVDGKTFFKKEEGILFNLSEAAKWGTVLIAVVTFLTLSSEWFYLLGEYNRIGVPELIPTLFAQNPVHSTGVLIFSSMSLVLFFSGYLTWAIIGYLTIKFPKRYKLGALFFFVMSFVYLTLIEKMTLPYTIVRSIAYFLVSYIQAIILFSHFYQTDFLKNKRFRGNYLIFTFIAAFTYIIVFFFLTTYRFGVDRADSILNGKSLLPEISLITTTKLEIDGWDQVKTENDEWNYSMSSPTRKSNIRISYLGMSDSDVYVLIFPSKNVYIIPKNNISSMSINRVNETINELFFSK